MSNSIDEPKLIYPFEMDLAHRREVVVAGILEGVVAQFDDGRSYQLNFVEFEHLVTESKNPPDAKADYLALPGLIVVSRVSCWIMALATRYAHANGYFERLREDGIKRYTPSKAELLIPDGCDLYESNARGYLEGAIVRSANAEEFPICFMLPWRLENEIRLDALNGKPFFVESGLVVVLEINDVVLDNVVKDISKDDFLNHLKPR